MQEKKIYLTYLVENFTKRTFITNGTAPITTSSLADKREIMFLFIAGIRMTFYVTYSTLPYEIKENLLMALQ